MVKTGQAGVCILEDGGTPTRGDTMAEIGVVLFCGKGLCEDSAPGQEGVWSMRVFSGAPQSDAGDTPRSMITVSVLTV